MIQHYLLFFLILIQRPLVVETTYCSEVQLFNGDLLRVRGYEAVLIVSPGPVSQLHAHILEY